MTDTPKPLTRAGLAKLRAVVERMTPVPWWNDGGCVEATTVTIASARPREAAGYADAEGIVAIRNAAEVLIAQVEDAMELMRSFTRNPRRDLTDSQLSDQEDATRAARALLAAYDADEADAKESS